MAPHARALPQTALEGLRVGAEENVREVRDDPPEQDLPLLRDQTGSYLYKIHVRDARLREERIDYQART